MTVAGLFFEGLVCLLLAAAAVLCFRVDRKLKALRDGQDGLKSTIAALDAAVERARASLAALDRASREAGPQLEARTREARQLADELGMLVERGEQGAERLAASRRREGARAGMNLPPRAQRAETPRSGAAGDAPRGLDALKTLR